MSRFIGEPITVEFDRPPLFSKRPSCPTRFVWDGQTFVIASILEQWVDFKRRGRMTRNMRPEHAAIAERRGSWGVGRFFFRVRTANGRAFELYYDRAPKNVDNRQGNWFLRQEL